MSPSLSTLHRGRRCTFRPSCSPARAPVADVVNEVSVQNRNESPRPGHDPDLVVRTVRRFPFVLGIPPTLVPRTVATFRITVDISISAFRFVRRPSFSVTSTLTLPIGQVSGIYDATRFPPPRFAYTRTWSIGSDLILGVRRRPGVRIGGGWGREGVDGEFRHHFVRETYVLYTRARTRVHNIGRGKYEREKKTRSNANTRYMYNISVYEMYENGRINHPSWRPNTRDSAVAASIHKYNDARARSWCAGARARWRGKQRALIDSRRCAPRVLRIIIIIVINNIISRRASYIYQPRSITFTYIVRALRGLRNLGPNTSRVPPWCGSVDEFFSLPRPVPTIGQFDIFRRFRRR